MAMTCRNCFTLTLSFIGMILGYSAFTSFIFFYSNYPAGVLAFLSGIFASLVFLLNYLEARGRTSDCYTSEHFRCIRLLAFVGILLGSSTTIWYTFMQLYYKTPILPAETSLIIPLVWAFMTMKWSIMLFFDTRRYSRLIEDEQTLLPTHSGRS